MWARPSARVPVSTGAFRRVLLALVAPLAFAQSIADHGAEVFARTCASGYCHGSNGQGGGAPKLAGRGFDEAYITTTTRAGVPGTSMQGYGTVLARPEFNAVVAYVATLNGIAPRTTEAAQRRLSPQAERGRELFSDPLRGFARCSTCHQVDGIGIAAAAISRVPGDLRDVAAPDVRTAAAGSDRFPALMVSSGGRRTIVYDLTSPPPVLRSFDSSAVRVEKGSTWNHRAVTRSYQDSELESILVFLKAVR